MRENRCIICGLKRGGLEVQEDRFIKSVRWFKTNVTRNEKNYGLVVCKDDFAKYKKARDGFVRKELAYTTLGIVFAIVLVVFSTHARLRALGVGAGIVVFLYLLSLLSYMPAVRMPDLKRRR